MGQGLLGKRKRMRNGGGGRGEKKRDSEECRQVGRRGTAPRGLGTLGTEERGHSEQKTTLDRTAEVLSCEEKKGTGSLQGKNR